MRGCPTNLTYVSRSACCVVACLAFFAVLVSAASVAEDDKPTPKEKPFSAANLVKMTFPFGNAAVDQDEAVAFAARYRAEKSAPKIFGAYVDQESQSLVVVGPAEAERYIHGLMAMWDCETAGGSGSESLRVQKLRLVSEYRRLIRDLTEMEILQVDRESRELADRIKHFSAKLENVKLKLEIVNKRQLQLNKFEQGITLKFTSPPSE